MKNPKSTINRDRTEIYRDFTLNLLYYIDNYYIDRETLSEDQDILNHYNWCFRNVCDEFLLEGLDFTENKELNEYFFSYYYYQYYKIDVEKNPHDTSLSYYENFWNMIFSVDKIKNKNILKIFFELYSIYDKSITKCKEIPEFV